MIYLDYAATTPVDEKVLARFVSHCRLYPGNANSAHALGLAAKSLVHHSSDRIASHFQVDSPEIIYTSGATEANNLAIIGSVYGSHKNGKHLITTGFEHSSVTACFAMLQQAGYQVDVVESDITGRVNIDHLAHLLSPNTILVSVGLVNGEIGIIQDISTIHQVVSRYSQALFHSDISQAIGRLKIDLSGMDLATLSGHKIYGLKGIGALIKKADIPLKPLFAGGKSLSPSRPGTPPVPLIHSLADAIDFVYEDYDEKHRRVVALHQRLKQLLKDIPGVIWNSHDDCVPEINNISICGHSANALQARLSQQGIYVSTKTACGSDQDYSSQILRLTASDDRARSSLRISLAPMTKPEELDQFAEALREAVQ